MKPAPGLKIHQLSVNYDKNPVLWDISLEVPAGKLVAIVGPNGAGKSTLMKSILGLIPPLSGKVSFSGLSLKEIRKKAAYIPQKESVDWDFPLTVFDLVLMGRFGRLGLFKRPSKQDREDVKKYLKMVNLEGFSHRQINQLSGGQKQRAFLARALIQEADFYFMDEPLAAIDVETSQAIIAILKHLRDQGKTIFVVLHDLEIVKEVFDWVILLNLRLVSCGPVSEVFTKEIIHKTYGKETLFLEEAAKLAEEKTRGYSLT